jgi:hypothetical protein
LVISRFGVKNNDSHIGSSERIVLDDKKMQSFADKMEVGVFDSSAYQRSVSQRAGLGNSFINQITTSHDRDSLNASIAIK